MNLFPELTLFNFISALVNLSGGVVNDNTTKKKFVGISVFYNGNERAMQLPIEIRVFQYTVNFQNTKGLNLAMTFARDNGKLMIQNFNINEPMKMKYVGNIADKN